MPFRWPTDPAGKAPAHTISWEAHQAALKPAAKPAGGGPLITTPNGRVPVSEWDFGWGKGVLQPPAATPPGATPSGQLPLPVDAGYDDQTESLAKTLAQTQAGLRGERQRTLIDYGFNEDPTNGALSLDPNNPFSKATLLKAQYDRDRRSTALGMGARGQLYAGAMQTGQDFLNSQQLQGEDALQKSLAAFLAGNTDQTTQAGIDYQMGMGQAMGDRTARAASNPLYSPDVRTSMPGASVGAATGGLGPAAAPTQPKPPLTLKAGPGVKAIKGVTKPTTTTKKNAKGQTVRTYGNTVLRP